VAFVSWALCAIFGGGVEKHVDGTTSTVAAPVPDEIRFLLMALSLLSVVALVLHQLGVYPPTTADPYINPPTQQTQTNE
jgi:hypothetical protein